MSTGARTVTILFTDLVGSTELLQRAGDEQAQRIFKAHHRLLRDAVESYGGHEVKWLGDGLMVAFDSAADAVKCAIAMQQASRRPTAGERLQIRAGLNVGEAFVDESDYFGTSVVIARRLCDRAGAGQIFAADIVTRLLDGRGADVNTKDLGPLELKGITNPVPAVEIIYQHDPMALLRKLPFVGRQAEYETLLKKLSEAANARGSVILLAGEPGIGKTRLTEEFLDHASSSATIIRGNCYEGDVSPPFGPWVEALRSLIEQLSDDQLREAVGDGAAEVAVLLPELRRHLPETGEAMKLDPESERARLFDAVAAFLKNASQQNPLIIFLDDLHWCDKPSLLLLEFVSRGVANQRIVIVGTYRDVEVNRVHPLAQALAALRRMEHHERLAIKGFPRDDIDALLESIEPSEQSRPVRRLLSAVLSRQTEGNPLYVREVITSLIESGKIVHEEGRWTSHVTSVEELGIPEGVKEAVGQRLSRLSDGCNQMLGRASAFTTGFTWDELAAVSDETEDELLDYLDEALGAQILAEPERERYTFTHAMIRHTLYEEMSTPRRARLHRRVAESLEALYAGDADAHLGELAAHYMASVGSDAEKAIDYAVRAGRKAMELVAWEEAAQHFQRALKVIPAEGGDLERHCRTLLDLGEVLIYTGQVSQAVDSYRRGAAVARHGGLAELLGEAACGFEEAGYFVLGDPDLPRQRLDLIDEALNALDEVDSALRARLLAQRTRPALAVGGTGDAIRTGGFGSLMGERDNSLLAGARGAVAMAERVGDPTVTAEAINYLSQALHGPGTDQERRELADSMVKLAKRAGHLRLEAAGRDLFFIATIGQGDMVAAREAHESGALLAEQTRVGWAVWSSLARRATLLLADGCLAESESAALEALSLGQSINNATATTAFGGQLFEVRWCQGRLAEIAGMFKTVAQQSPNVAIYQAAMALIYSETGQADEAQLVIDAVPERGADTIPEDGFWKMTICGLAEVSARLRDREVAHALYQVARRHAEGNVCAGNSVSIGAFARSLGQLATVLERWEEAERHFEDALNLNEKMVHRPALAFTRRDYGDMLLRRNAPGDRERARRLLEQALEAAREMGMAKVVEDCERLLAEVGGLVTE
jgi:class 3 adenylate cyclase/tetratricopeptide (TPR) repeat protein